MESGLVSFVIGRANYLARVTYIIVANNKFKQPVRLRTASTIPVIAVNVLTVLAAVRV
jgi:hypothetical protein